MRFAAALSAAAAVLALTGCVFSPDEELQGDVMNIAPKGAELIECGWEKNWGSDSNSSYECIFGAQGNVVSAGNKLLVRAGRQGFTVWCDGSRHRLEIAGVNRNKSLLIEVLERGFTSARTISATDTEIPAGHVLIDIAVVKAESPATATGRRCIPK